MPLQGTIVVLEKVRMQHAAMAAALNPPRTTRWLMGDIIATTHKSHLGRLLFALAAASPRQRYRILRWTTSKEMWFQVISIRTAENTTNIIWHNADALYRMREQG